MHVGLACSPVFYLKKTRRTVLLNRFGRYKMHSQLVSSLAPLCLFLLSRLRWPCRSRRLLKTRMSTHPLSLHSSRLHMSLSQSSRPRCPVDILHGTGKPILLPPVWVGTRPACLVERIGVLSGHFSETYTVLHLTNSRRATALHDAMR